jgi:hypothetical protein
LSVRRSIKDGNSTDREYQSTNDDKQIIDSSRRIKGYHYSHWYEAKLVDNSNERKAVIGAKNLSQDIRNRLVAHQQENTYARYIKPPTKKSLPFLLAHNQ